MKKKHRKLPDLHLLNELFDYDPLTGGLYKKAAEHCEANALGSPNREGRRLLYIPGSGTKTPWLLHRIVFYMYHRRDPKHFMVDHINGDPGDNRINNLRCVRPSKNARNQRKKGHYEVDDEGVGRWVTSCP
mgnify:CR=1 FL=1